MPISKKTGKRYAAGSSKSYGGWEDRHCYHCGRTLTLKHDHAWHAINSQTGQAFTFCRDHLHLYREAFAGTFADFELGDVDHADAP